MTRVFAHCAALPAAIVLSAVPASAQESVPPATGPTVPNWIIYVVLAPVIVALLAAFTAMRRQTNGPRWSISDALSGEATITDSAGRNITELRASASRFIALVGTIVILALYLGFGLFVLYDFAAGGVVPASIDTASKYLLTGLTLFAPY